MDISTLPEVKFVMGKQDPADTKDDRKGFEIGFKKFHIEFLQGTFVDSELKANLYIPKLADPTKPIAIDIFVDADCDFDLTATFTNKKWPSDPENDPPNGIIGFDDIFRYKMGYVSVRKDDNVVYLETAGELLFTHPAIKKVIEDPIILKKLRINSDGSFEIQGGSIPLPKSASPVSYTHLTLPTNREV